MVMENQRVHRQLTAPTPCGDCGEGLIVVLHGNIPLDGQSRQYRRVSCAGCGKVRSQGVRFGMTAAHPDGSRAVKGNCLAEVPVGGRSVGFRQCQRRAMAGPGQRYCGVHAKEVAALLERQSVALAAKLAAVGV